MARRVYLSFSDDEMIRLLKWNQTGLPLSTAVKWLVLDALHIMSGEFATTPIGSNTLRPGSGKFPSGATTPTPSPARARKKSSLKTPDPEKKKEKKRGGGARGGQADLLGTDPGPTSEPFVQEVVGHLNKACGTVFPPTDKNIRELVAKLMATGYTIDDMKTVNTWAAERWPGGDKKKDYWRSTFLVPSKLYGEKFAEHLGVARGAEQRAEEEAKPWRPPADEML